MMRRRPHGTLLLLFAASVCACEPTQPEALDFETSCDGRELAPCDVRDPACVRPLADFIACLREEQPLPTLPAVQTQTPADYRAMRVDMGKSPAGLQTNTALDELGRDMALVGVGSAATPLSTPATQTGKSAVTGWYNGQSDIITMIDRGLPFDSEQAWLTLAHELVHAMQYRSRDIAGFLGTGAPASDERLARRAIVEGEAVLYTNMVRANLAGRSWWDTYWNRWFHDAEAPLWVDAADNPDLPRQARSAFPYTRGGAYATTAWKHDQTAGVQRLYDPAIPKHTRAVMVATTVTPTAIEPPPIDLSTRTPVLPAELDALGPPTPYKGGTWSAAMLLEVTGPDRRGNGVYVLDEHVWRYRSKTGKAAIIRAWRCSSAPVAGSFATMLTDFFGAKGLNAIVLDIGYPDFDHELWPMLFIVASDDAAHLPALLQAAAGLLKEAP